MEIYAKISLISIFLFSSGFRTWFYQMRWFYPYHSFKHSKWQGRSGALKSRDLTTRHQIKQIATSWTSVGPRKNRTCWKISEWNPVWHDSTAALVVACSFCVQSAILSALIRSPYSCRSTTAATATAARTKTRTDRRLCQQRQLQRRRNLKQQPWQQPRTTVAKCASWRRVLASHWCRADIEHVDSI